MLIFVCSKLLFGCALLVGALLFCIIMNVTGRYSAHQYCVMSCHALSCYHMPSALHCITSWCFMTCFSNSVGMLCSDADVIGEILGIHGHDTVTASVVCFLFVASPGLL